MLTNQKTLAEIVEFLLSSGESPETLLSASKPVKQPCSLKHPKPNGLCFFKQKRWADQSLDFTSISLLLTDAESVSEELKASASQSGCAIITVSNPRLAFIHIVSEFFQPKPVPFIHPTASITDKSYISDTCSIGAGTFIGENVKIGEHSIIEANVSIGDNTTIGDNCYIAPGVAIGQAGFGYERNADGMLVQFPHLGRVAIGNDVHIGANTCIDRGTLDNTVIGDRVRIDNLCHISHNVHIGSDCAIIANSMIGGSVKIGVGGWVAPSSSVINGIELGSNIIVGMAAVVTKPVSDDQVVAGSPAVPIAELKHRQARMKELLA